MKEELFSSALGYLVISKKYFSVGGWGLYIGFIYPCLNIILEMLTAIMKGPIEHRNFKFPTFILFFGFVVL